MFLAFLVFAALVLSALATPLNITLVHPLILSKRGAPLIQENDYSTQQVQQIKEGHLDAIKMASMVVSQSKNPETFDPIFKNYFQLSDRDTVINVFKQIIGPKDLRYGNSLLAEITVVKDFKDENGEVACSDPKIDAELLDPATENPKLVVCPRAFTRSAFSGKGYPSAPVVTCGHCYPRISRKMENIGMVLLHEYTHWDKLVAPVMPPAYISTSRQKSTLDYVY